MNSEDENNNFDDNSRNAGNFHIAPEVGEQGEGPGEQPVRRANTRMVNDIEPRPRPGRSIEITEVSTESVASSPAPGHEGRFNHGEEDVMRYFTDVTAAPASDKNDDLPDLPDDFASISMNQPVKAKQQPGVDSVTTDTANRYPTNGDFRHQAHQPDAPRILADSPQPRHEHDDHPAKKSTLALTIVVVLITILVTALAVFIVLKITQSGSKDNEVVEITVANKVETSSITCTKSADEEALEAAGKATQAKTTIIANYADDDLEDFSEMTNYTYADATAAKDGLATVKKSYSDKYTDLGLSQDPFSSTYSQNGSATTVSHFAESSDLSFENMVLLNIPQTNGTNPDLDAVKAALTDGGYICKVKSID